MPHATVRERLTPQVLQRLQRRLRPGDRLEVWDTAPPSFVGRRVVVAIPLLAGHLLGRRRRQ